MNGETQSADEIVQQIRAAVVSAQADREAGRLVEALAGFRAAERLCTQHGLVAGGLASTAMQGQGVVLLDQGMPAEALKPLGRAFARLGPPGEKYDDAEVRVHVMTTTAICLRTLGRYGDADRAYRLAIEIAERDPGEPLANVLSSYGALWSVLGDTGQARALYEEGLRVLDAHAPESPQRAGLLLNLGGALRDAGELVESVGALEEGLALTKRVGSRRLQAQALQALSDCHRKAGNLASARGYAQEAAEIAAQDNPESEIHARCLGQLAELAMKEGELAIALEASERAHEILARIAPRTRDIIESGARLAAVQLASGKVDEGTATAKGIYESAEILRSEAPVGTTRQTLTRVTARAAEVYAAALTIRAEGGGDARAFVDALERRQARHLVDQMDVGSIESVPGDIAEQVRELRKARRGPGRVLQHTHWALQAIAGGQDGPLSVGELRRARARAQHDLHLLDEAIDERLPRTEPAETLTAEEMQIRLEPDECLIHCFASGAGIAMATLTNTSLRVHVIDGSYDAVKQVVARVEEEIRDGAPVSLQLLGDLSAMLYSNVPDEAERIVVVADGPLHNLPFAIVPDPHGDEPIGIRRRISQAASATAWFAARERAVGQALGELLLVGDPAYTAEQLPGARDPRLGGTAREVDEIENRVGATPTILVGVQASESRVGQEIPRHQRSHIACHGLVDSDDARYSGLLLAPPTDAEAEDGHDDLLQAWEIAELDLSCEAVVVSACSAASGEVVPGAGLVGLVNAFQLAGVRQVVAPLWPIADQIVPDVLASLYGHVERGNPLDEALRLMRYDFRNAALKHWACWSLYGPSSP